DPVTVFPEEGIKRFLVTAKPLAKGKMVKQPHEIGEVNVSNTMVAFDHERVLVVLGSGIFAEVRRAGNHKRVGVQRLDLKVRPHCRMIGSLGGLVGDLRKMRKLAMKVGCRIDASALDTDLLKFVVQ